MVFGLRGLLVALVVVLVPRADRITAKQSLVVGRNLGTVFAVYAIAADGTNLTKLSSGPDDVAPSWSPDGTTIAFVRNDRLFLFGVATRRLRAFARSGRISWFAWSPNSKRLVVADEQKSLRMITLNGSSRRLTTLAPFGAPVWSPTGQSILVNALRGLYTVSVPGGVARQIPRASAAETYAWLPDGKAIIFAYDGSDTTPGAIERVALDGTGSAELLAMGADEIALSPDGERLAFVHQELGEGAHVWVLRFADGFTRRLTNSGECDGQLSWSPDSTTVAFLRGGCGGGNTTLLRIPAGGGTVTRVATGVGSVQWDPLSRSVPKAPKLGRPNYITRIYDRVGRNRGFVVRHAHDWTASWDKGLDPTVEALKGRFDAYCEAHLTARAQPSVAGRWSVRTVSNDPGELTHRLGNLVRRSDANWNIFDVRQRPAGRTLGPDGLPAGIAWLALHDCR